MAAADRISEAEGQRAGFDHEVALRDLREECLCDYIKAAWPIIEPVTRYLHNWHIDAIAEHLEAVTNGEIRRLIINIPPRYMKSICVSVMWPTWEWGPRKMPHARWMFCSHAADLSIKHSDDRRTVMTSPWYRECWGDRFRLVKSLESEYSNDHRGRVIATSVNGQATGKGYNRVVIDDLLDPEQALSDTLRTTANRIFDEKFSKRLDDKRKDAIVIVMQRLHNNDLAGHVLGPMKEEGWATLILPAEAQGRQKIVFPRSGTVVERQEGGPTTITRREDPLIEEFARLAPKKDVLGVEVIDDGALLWPEREGPEEIAEVKLVMGKDAFAGQYQQRPAPLGGGMIERYWFRVRRDNYFCRSRQLFLPVRHQG